MDRFNDKLKISDRIWARNELHTTVGKIQWIGLLIAPVFAKFFRFSSPWLFLFFKLEKISRIEKKLFQWWSRQFNKLPLWGLIIWKGWKKIWKALDKVEKHSISFVKNLFQKLGNYSPSLLWINPFISLRQTEKIYHPLKLW